MIADLDMDDFQIKTADRLSNLDDLKAVGLPYVLSNLESTDIYMEKAKALWRIDLVEMLEVWLKKLDEKKRQLKGWTTVS